MVAIRAGLPVADSSRSLRVPQTCGYGPFIVFAERANGKEQAKETSAQCKTAEV